MSKTPAITFSTSPKLKADTAVVFVTKDKKLTAAGTALDTETGGLLTAAIKRQTSFDARVGQAITIQAPAKSALARIILVGLGDVSALTARDYEAAGAKIHAALTALDAAQVIIHADYKDSGADDAAAIATGLVLKTYGFDAYRSKKKDQPAKTELAKVEIVLPAAAKATAAFKHQQAVATGVFLARDLVNTPPNDLYPESYAKRIKAELGTLGVKVEILDDKKLKELGFGAHLAVGQGSIRPPRVVIMRWNGLGEGKKAKSGPLALVGKGITFDTGGISLKPGAGMDEMKMDMGGSAAVVGAIKALALRKAKTDVVGIVALAENMPSDRAYRPGDIITSLSGKTVEILNTDAEGRLVLCDSLTYVQQKYKPSAIIDLATLTGAIIVALANEYCGSFVNDDTLWSRIDAAGKATGEKYWRMPLDETYRKDVESKVADLRNIGSIGKGGSCTAAAFLEWFIEGDTPWAHLDIAGTGMSSSIGGTGFGVRTLDRLIADHYES